MNTPLLLTYTNLFQSKFSQTVQGMWRVVEVRTILTCQDSSFVATLFTGDTERLMRYTDEGELTELCKWTVDLSSLPTFKQNASVGATGFYTGMLSTPKSDVELKYGTEFELGLELDSAEVRGILLYNGQEWGRRVLCFDT